MGNLNPGGSRNTGKTSRIYGAKAIERACDLHKDILAQGNSIADKPHAHSREVARRLRQQERRKAK